MSMTSEILSQLFKLPPLERFSVAQQLLDSIDDSEAAGFDDQFIVELRQRRAEMLRGDQIVPDWRLALVEIEQHLAQPN